MHYICRKHKAYCYTTVIAVNSRAIKLINFSGRAGEKFKSFPGFKPAKSMSEPFSHRAALQCLCLNQMCSYGSIFLDIFRLSCQCLDFWKESCSPSERVMCTFLRCGQELNAARRQKLPWLQARAL